MKAIIVDDEFPARTRLFDLLESIPDMKVVGEAENGRDAIKLCFRLKPDIVFLDIRMPGMDGMEAAHHISTLIDPPAIVFTTAYSDHALEAFEACAIDYLLKPVKLGRLSLSVEKAEKMSTQNEGELKKRGVMREQRTHIMTRSRDKVDLIPVDDIIYFQADQKYITIAHKHGEALIEESLKSLEQEFEGAFLRIHRNALIRYDCLTGLEKDPAGHVFAVLKNSEAKLEVSRRHTANVRKQLKNKIKT